MYRKFDVTENLFFFWNSTFLVELNTAKIWEELLNGKQQLRVHNYICQHHLHSKQRHANAIASRRAQTTPL
jgi:hypothetical protein